MMDSQPDRVRRPAVAGLFYPGDARALAESVRDLLHAAPQQIPVPRALIVPHAGYVYSGAVAARGYAALAPVRRLVRRVVLLGPSHRVPLRGMAVPSVEAFETPLGLVALDRPALERAAGCADVVVSDAPHAADHALEVQLPFLQSVLERFRLAPIAVGATSPDAVADVLEAIASGPETLIVVSSDLSHFHRYESARAIDGETCRAIVERSTGLSGDQACGCHGINGLMAFARRRGLDVELLAQRNSGDVTGDLDRVVGYATFALHAN